MGVLTDADYAIEECREAVQTAVEKLSSVVITRGHDDYRRDYKERVDRAMRLLLESRDLLDPSKLPPD